MKRAFTLVEVLVVVLIISILVGISATMLTSARETARVTRTKSLIATIEEIIATRMESYQSRPFAIVPPSAGVPAATTGNVRFRLAPREAARVRLLMLRDTMRMELPDRYSDIIADNTISVAAGAFQNALPIQASYQVLSGVAAVPTSATVNAPVSWWTASGTPNQNIPSLLMNYRSRIPLNTTPGPDFGKVLWTPEFASAECLYLILSTTFIGGTSATEMLPRGQVGDVDDDGMPEVLDSWGTPIGFIRWPVGYVPPGYATLAAVPTRPDEFDPFQADFFYNQNDVPPAVQAGAATAPRSLDPLIISAGPDRVFDIRFALGSTAATDVSYATQSWPKTADWMGAETAGRPGGTYYYIDPFLRQSSAGLLGEYLDEDSDGLASPDNITNYDPESTQ